MSQYVADLLAGVKAKNPAEPEFHQRLEDVWPPEWSQKLWNMSA